MPTLVAVMREPARSFCYHAEARYQKVLAQHRSLQDIYRRHGYTVELLPRSRKYIGSTFTQDVALIVKDQGILLNCLSSWRKKEPRHGDQVRKVLSKYLSKVEQLGLPALLDGGEVIQTDREIIVGTACGAAHLAVQQIRRKLDLDRPVRTLTTRGFPYIHTGSEMSYLGNGIMLATERFARTAPCQRYETWVVPPHEEIAANCVRLHDGTILAPFGYPDTIRMLVQGGFDVELVNLSEFNKANGAISCMSLNIEL